jgi:DNA-binding GntR family transcriptional regulator
MTDVLHTAPGSSMLHHVSLPDSVHGALKRRILNNDLEAGTRLVEATLANEMGVSRSTLRVALRQLAQEGLVEISPRRQSVVTRLSPEEIGDACYARYALEEGAMQAVSDDRLDALADGMERFAARMEQAASAGELATIVDLDARFHGCIVEESGKRRLAALWETLTAQMGAVMRSSMENQQIDLFEAARRHRQLVDVFRARDRVAIADALYEHYLTMPS